MNADEQARHEEALDWVRRIADPAFADWDAHLAWLERDPRNPVAFDQASLLMDEATQGLGAEPPPFAATPNNDNVPEPSHPLHHRWLSAGALAAAAALAAVIGLRDSPSSEPARTVVATGAGQNRTVRLEDGTVVALNGDTRLSFTSSRKREARLEHGEAFFSVAPQTGHRFKVLAGDTAIQDLATAFDVKRDGEIIDVSVREGAVLFDPDRAAVHLREGQQITATGGTATVREIDPRSAGSWTEGRLVYRDATLPVVARDLQRAIGVPVTVARELQSRHFAGVIILDRDRPILFRRLGKVMGVEVTKDGMGWRLARAQR